MGIIRAAIGSAGSVLQEQWLEFFCCDSLDGETLLKRGTKHVGERSTNTRADDNIISNGSILAVADGQCVLVVSQGKVIDQCAEPGEHRFEDPNRAGGIGGYFRDVKSRIAFGGGDVQPIRHRIYYVNTKECLGVRFDTPAFAWRVRDPAIGADLDLSVQVGGVFSYRVTDPATLYRRVVGNIEHTYQRTELNGMLVAAVRAAIPEALTALTEDGVRPYALALHAPALRDALRDRLSEPFAHYGLTLGSLAFDMLIVQDHALTAAQAAAVNRDPNMAAATTVDAVASLNRHLGNGGERP